METNEQERKDIIDASIDAIAPLLGKHVTIEMFDEALGKLADIAIEKLTGKDKNKDLSFLREMKEKTEKLLHDRYDITIVESLDGMIGDWIHELNNKTHENRKSKRHY